MFNHMTIPFMAYIHDLLQALNADEALLERDEFDCCGVAGRGGACDCHDNSRSEIRDILAELAIFDLVFVDNVLCETKYVDGKLVTTEVPLDILESAYIANLATILRVDDAQEGYYPDAF